MSFQTFPEILLIPWLESLPIEDLLNLCQTETYYRDICNDDSIWRGRLRREFPGKLIPEGMTAREFYRQLYLSMLPIDLYLNNQPVDRIYVYSETSHDQLRDYIRDRLNLSGQYLMLILNRGRVPLIEFSTGSVDFILQLNKITEPVSKVFVYTEFPNYQYSQFVLSYFNPPESYHINPITPLLTELELFAATYLGCRELNSASQTFLIDNQPVSIEYLNGWRNYLVVFLNSLIPFPYIQELTQ